MSKTIEYKLENGIATLAVLGELNNDNIPELELLLDQSLAEGAALIEVDFQNAEFLPSICFGTLINYGQLANEKGCVLRVRMDAHCARLAQAVGLNQVVEIQVIE